MSDKHDDRPTYHSTHSYKELTEDRRPQDHSGDLAGWTFEACEHGGEFRDCMPLAIVATDAEGRSCIYAPIEHGGRIVDSLNFQLTTEKAKPA